LPNEIKSPGADNEERDTGYGIEKICYTENSALVGKPMVLLRLSQRRQNGNGNERRNREKPYPRKALPAAQFHAHRVHPQALTSRKQMSYAKSDTNATRHSPRAPARLAKNVGEAVEQLNLKERRARNNPVARLQSAAEAVPAEPRRKQSVLTETNLATH
jgi:hypothetical protein